MLKLSKRTRKNPGQTSTLMKTNEKDLVRLFRNFRMMAILYLGQGRLLADEPPLLQNRFSLAFLVRVLEDITGTTITGPGEALVQTRMQQSYRGGTLFAGMTMQRAGITVTVGEGPADWRVMDVLKVRNLSSLKGITEEMNKQIVQELSDGIMKGEGMQDLAKRLSDRVESIGITRARTMARTETMYSFNQGAITRYGQQGFEQVEWLTAHDERLCDECGPLDGKVFPITDIPDIPLHANCRCVLLPVVED